MRHKLLRHYAEIAEMANDPDIQVEIVAIDREFIVAEMDGLEAL